MGYENARAERDFRQNPPTSAPGQDFSDGSWENMQEGSSSVDVAPITPTYNTDINSTLNNGVNVQGQGQSQNNTNPPPVGGAEEVFYKVLFSAGKGLLAYIKGLVESFTNNTPNDWHILGVRIVYVSFACAVTGGLLAFINLFVKSNNTPSDLIIGGILSGIFGFFLSCFFKKDSEVPEPVVEESELDSAPVDTSSSDYAFAEDFDFEDEEEEEDDEDEYEEDDSWDDVLDNSSLFDDSDDSSSSVESPDFDAESVVSSLPSISPGTQTRQFLFETFMKVLPKVSPRFDKMTSIDSESDDFYEFEELLRGAAEQLNTKEENIPELLSVSENQFIYRLNCTRPTGIKEQEIANEIASSFARDENNIKVRDGVYATVETSINNYTINLFKGTAVCLSLGDIYSTTVSNFVKDPSVLMPFIWGVNELGKVLYCDMKDINSIIISGKPRGGKSWKGQSIIAQLAMFNSPKEVEFYFFDNKRQASDYYSISHLLPHAKFFCGIETEINNYIQLILDKALEERAKMITDAGCINIKDYNKMHPNSKIPYMYIVIDELMALMDYFNSNDLKEEAARFRGFTSTMVSKMAYTGVRFIMFPHRIVDSVIGKNTYSLVPCRVIVNQVDQEQVKASVGVTPQKFPYLLSNVGDMAIRCEDVNNGAVSFCHAEILSSDNAANTRLFKYIGEVWKKLEPDCKCLDFDGYIGGSITINGSEVRPGRKQGTVEKSKPKKVAKDNTGNADEFKYTGYDEDYESFDNSMEDLPDLEPAEDVDESFWDEFGE